MAKEARHAADSANVDPTITNTDTDIVMEDVPTVITTTSNTAVKDVPPVITTTDTDIVMEDVPDIITTTSNTAVEDVPPVITTTSNTAIEDAPAVITTTSNTAVEDVPPVITTTSNTAVEDVPPVITTPSNTAVEDVPPVITTTSNTAVEDVPPVITTTSNTAVEDVPPVITTTSNTAIEDVPPVITTTTTSSDMPVVEVTSSPQWKPRQILNFKYVPPLPRIVDGEALMETEEDQMAQAMRLSIAEHSQRVQDREMGILHFPPPDSSSSSSLSSSPSLSSSSSSSSSATRLLPHPTGREVMSMPVFNRAAHQAEQQRRVITESHGMGFVHTPQYLASFAKLSPEAQVVLKNMVAAYCAAFTQQEVTVAGLTAIPPPEVTHLVQNTVALMLQDVSRNRPGQKTRKTGDGDGSGGGGGDNPPSNEEEMKAIVRVQTAIADMTNVADDKLSKSALTFASTLAAQMYTQLSGESRKSLIVTLKLAFCEHVILMPASAAGLLGVQTNPEEGIANASSMVTNLDVTDVATNIANLHSCFVATVAILASLYNEEMQRWQNHRLIMQVSLAAVDERRKVGARSMSLREFVYVLFLGKAPPEYNQFTDPARIVAITPQKIARYFFRVMANKAKIDLVKTGLFNFELVRYLTIGKGVLLVVAAFGHIMIHLLSVMRCFSARHVQRFSAPQALALITILQRQEKFPEFLAAFKRDMGMPENKFLRSPLTHYAKFEDDVLPVLKVMLQDIMEVVPHQLPGLQIMEYETEGMPSRDQLYVQPIFDTMIGPIDNESGSEDVIDVGVNMEQQHLAHVKGRKQVRAAIRAGTSAAEAHRIASILHPGVIETAAQLAQHQQQSQHQSQSQSQSLTQTQTETNSDSESESDSESQSQSRSPSHSHSQPQSCSPPQQRRSLAQHFRQREREILLQQQRQQQREQQHQRDEEKLGELANPDDVSQWTHSSSSSSSIPPIRPIVVASKKRTRPPTQSKSKQPEVPELTSFHPDSEEAKQYRLWQAEEKAKKEAAYARYLQKQKDDNFNLHQRATANKPTNPSEWAKQIEEQNKKKEKDNEKDNNNNMEEQAGPKDKDTAEKQ
jgi:hypothetical protein